MNNFGKNLALWIVIGLLLVALFNLFQTFLNSPDLINCGLHAPQKMNLVHSGEAWVLELEATVESGA